MGVDVSQFEKYTIAQLRDIASEGRMVGVSFTTKTRKPAMIDAIERKIDFLHGDALAENVQREKVAALPDFSARVTLIEAKPVDTYTLPGTDVTWEGELATEMRKHMRRSDNFKKQHNGTLTPKQRRRLRKKANRKLGRGMLAALEVSR